MNQDKQPDKTEKPKPTLAQIVRNAAITAAAIIGCSLRDARRDLPIQSLPPNILGPDNLENDTPASKYSFLVEQPPTNAAAASSAPFGLETIGGNDPTYLFTKLLHGNRAVALSLSSGLETFLPQTNLGEVRGSLFYLEAQAILNGRDNTLNDSPDGSNIVLQDLPVSLEMGRVRLGRIIVDLQRTNELSSDVHMSMKEEYGRSQDAQRLEAYRLALQDAEATSSTRNDPFQLPIIVNESQEPIAYISAEGPSQNQQPSLFDFHQGSFFL
jgi:hypothetical protein